MKKKSLLLAISAMSIAAIGVGTVGTFAWYSATVNYTGAKTSAQAPTGTLSGDSSAAQAENLYLKLTATVNDSDTCYLTTSDGYVYYVDANNHLRGPVNVANANKADLYGEITFSAAFYQEAGGTNLATAEQLNTLAEGSLNFTLGASSGSRARLADSVSFTVTDSPYAVAGFATDFGDAYLNELTLTVAWTAKGASFTVKVGSQSAAAIGSAKAYYAIGGTAAIADKASQDAIVAARTTVAPDATLTGTLTLA